MKILGRLIWPVVLLIGYVGVAPVLVALLRQALHAAQEIEHYSERILASGGGIAQNTANVAALNDTLAAAPQLIEAADALHRHTSAIRTALAPPSASDNAEVVP